MQIKFFVFIARFIILIGDNMLEKICLYNIKSVKKIMQLLFIDDKNKLGKIINKYNVYRDKKTNRIISEPIWKLKEVHNRIYKLLTKNVNYFPGYLISKKGFSAVDNYKIHKDNKYIATMDIQKFFPSCNFDMVYNFFKYKMNNSYDVAIILAELCTVDLSRFPVQISEDYNFLNKRHLPTGSPISQVLSFMICKEYFDNIFSFLSKRDCNFSLYVDDITISSNKPIRSTTIRYIKNYLRKKGLNVNKGKCHIYRYNDNKIITGVVLKGKRNIPMVKNKTTFKLVKLLRLPYKNSLVHNKIRGLLYHINSIDKNKFSHLISTYCKKR